MYRRPKELSRYLLFIDPFTPFVWACIAAMTVVMGPIFWVIHRYSYFYKYYDAVTPFGLFRVDECVWFVYASLIQQVAFSTLTYSLLFAVLIIFFAAFSTIC